MSRFIRSGAIISTAALACSLLGAAAPAGAATAATVPVIRESAIVFAPTASKLAGGQQQVSVGLNATTQFGSEVSIRRVTLPHRNTYHVTEYAGDVAVGEAGVADFNTMRAGDLIEVQIAIREANPNAGNFGNSIALRAVDLRTGQSSTFGNARLLQGSPPVPAHLAVSTRQDISRTETTWGHGWTDTTVGLADEAVRQSPTGYDTFVGVTQTGTSFFITDKADPHIGGPISTVSLHPANGDPITLQASTPLLGRHTTITITDHSTHTHLTATS
jgi:hypothetical protein